MTQNQIRYAELQETNRHNLVYETETNRHNVVTEQIGWHTAESQRISAQAAMVGAYAAQTQAAAAVTQANAAMQNAATNAKNAITNRINANVGVRKSTSEIVKNYATAVSSLVGSLSGGKAGLASAAAKLK